MAVIPEVLEIPPSTWCSRSAGPSGAPTNTRSCATTARFLEVQEGGLRFLVNLTDYLDTGLFLDHRLTRALIRELAPGRRFLNLFAYTGTATVYAAAGGAAATTTVDLSPTYLDWARRNLELNGFSGAAHSFVRADCLDGWDSRGRRGGSPVQNRPLRPHLPGRAHLLQLQEHGGSSTSSATMPS